jgi:hypothetical protein
MASHGCPQWTAEPDDKLASIARGLDDFYRFVKRKSKTYTLNANDIKMWHGKVFGLAAPLGYYAGNFRGADPQKYHCLSTDVSVDGIFGAPFQQVQSLMHQFSDDLTATTEKTDQYVAATSSLPDRLQAVVQLAVFCATKIIQIHPFINGNGRMSRITADYFLARYSFPYAFYPPFARPGLSYERAAALCMRGDPRPLYEYLLTLTVEHVLALATPSP